MKADSWPNRDFFLHTWFNLWIFMWSLCAPLCSHFYVFALVGFVLELILYPETFNVCHLPEHQFFSQYIFILCGLLRERKERNGETINTIHFMVEVAGEKKTGRWGNKYLTVKFFAIHENEIQYSERGKCWNL